MNNSSSSSSSDNGLSFASVLQIVFIVLKLCKVINWSWIWVLAPFWITMIIYGIIGVAFYLKLRKLEKLRNQK